MEDKYVYAIKAQLICMCVNTFYIRTYMFVCPELIEETGRPTGLIFGILGYFCLARTSSSLGRKFTHLTKL